MNARTTEASPVAYILAFLVAIPNELSEEFPTFSFAGAALVGFLDLAIFGLLKIY
jgi:hypothetical protein